MGRPKKNIDPKQVASLAAINCSYEEMAAVLDCSTSILTKRFYDVIEKGRGSGRMSLKRKQYEMAMGGNVTMLIWLGKQNLGQTEKMEYRGEYPYKGKDSGKDIAAEVKELLDSFKGFNEARTKETPGTGLLAPIGAPHAIEALPAIQN